MTEIKRNTNNEKLIKAVNYLRLEFPVVEIAEKMNMDKGNISSYLNNKKSVSSNFIKKFEEAFNIDTSNFEFKPETKNPQQNSEGFTQERVAFLINENEFLKETVRELLKTLNK